MSERMLTTAEVCRLLDVSRQTLHTWIRQGRFPKAQQHGGSGSVSRWPESAVQERLLQREVPLAQRTLRVVLEDAEAGPLIHGCDGALLGYTRDGDKLRSVYDRAEAIRLLEVAGHPAPLSWTQSREALGVVWVDRDPPPQQADNLAD